MITEGSVIWSYLSEHERILAGDGAFLIRDSDLHKDEEPTDYSYIVFPYAKLYEGFLKDLFRDLSIISERDYASKYFRIGKVLSPNLMRRLGKRSAYGVIAHRFGNELADRLWHTWKEGRNLTFHYFPHAVRLLTRDEACAVINSIEVTMELAIKETNVHRMKE